MEHPGKSLIDAKALTEPAVKLIEAVRATVGALYEPTRIRRKALADADAAVIATSRKIKTNDMLRRAAERTKNRELRRQSNIESIASKALLALPERANDQPVNTDWIVHFFENCQDIGDDQMQRLWAKILAGEVSQPGSYSLRTLNAVKLFSKDDADMFTRFCRYLWHNGYRFVHIRTNESEAILRADGLPFLRLLDLESMGLTQGSDLMRTFPKGESYVWSYHGKPYAIKSPLIKKAEVPTILLTDIGDELATISGAKPSHEYEVSAVNRFRQSGLTINPGNGKK